ncbi:MAG TPA: phosphotransferase [Ktedonobacteraceae bacterium]|nr:phosphotransferase [Ktedonobacteraceae bacterium]
MDILNLWTVWPVSGPWRIAPLEGGTNNSVWRADGVDGQSYVLRILSDLSSIPRCRYEAQLLQMLSESELPFRLPLPLRAKHGDIVVLFEWEGSTAVAMLYPLLPGRLQDFPPESNDLVSASHAGAALALLDTALATLPEIPYPDGFTPLLPFGELAHWHPSALDPLAALERLPVDYEQKTQIRLFLSQVLESVPRLYAQLPQQLLHRDYDPGNVLFDQQHAVTAILDFEFAGRDIRVLDLCVALSWWPANVLGTGKEWDLIDAFGAAYTRLVPLSQEELLAIPAVFRLRDALSFVHRMGRYLAGGETESRMQARVQHSLMREAWLSAHQETLLNHVLAWN